MIGQCPKCGNWHTNPYFCPADLSNRGASEPLRDWRDAEIERLAARLAAAERDARRYRWLRGATGWSIQQWLGLSGVWTEYLSGPTLDAAIDAELERQP